MASIKKDPLSGNFRIRFRFAQCEFNRSLKTKNETTAGSILARTEETIRLVEQGRIDVPPNVDIAKFLLGDGKINATKPHLKPISLRQLLKTYQKRLPAAAKEPLTVALEKTHIANFLRLMPAGRQANAINTAVLQRYVEKRLKEKHGNRLISPETVKREMDTFRSIWNWAKKEFVEGEAPTIGLTLSKADAKPPFMTWSEIERRISRGGLSDDQESELWECLYLTTPEINEMLEYAKNRNRYPFIHPMLTFVAYTGVRRSEMMRARIDDFDFDSKTILIREKKRSRVKATTYRRVDMARQLSIVIQEWFAVHPGGQYAFCMPPKDDGIPSPLTRDQARDQFRRTFRKSKWEKARGYHVLRHSFASNLASKGVDQRIIDLWMGHQTEAMRLRYRHLLPSSRHEAIERLFC